MEPEAQAIGDVGSLGARAADALKLSFMTAGLEPMSQTCRTVCMAAGRGTQPTQAKIFRESVGALRFQIELETRTILREDQERRDKAGKA